MRAMRWERALLLALLLGSCGQRLHWTEHSADDAYDLADAAQANARTALARIESLSSRTGDSEDLAGDIRRLRLRVEALEARPDLSGQRLNERIENAQDRIDGLARTIRAAGVAR